MYIPIYYYHLVQTPLQDYFGKCSALWAIMYYEFIWTYNYMFVQNQWCFGFNGKI